jgi:hypothetical protein
MVTTLIIKCMGIPKIDNTDCQKLVLEHFDHGSRYLVYHYGNPFTIHIHEPVDLGNGHVQYKITITIEWSEGK